MMGEFPGLGFYPGGIPRALSWAGLWVPPFGAEDDVALGAAS
jgi:hypothetical protein